MLWVCLDLLFVALWSSAMSIATNDYIATPLECTSSQAWWRDGLADDYANLLDQIAISCPRLQHPLSVRRESSDPE